MSVIGNRYLNGEPILPYARVMSYDSTDVFLDLTFLDRSGVPCVPTAITLELDDITNSVTMAGPTPLNANGSAIAPFIYPGFASAMTIQIPGSVMQMTYPSVGSQICQLAIQWQGVDSVTGTAFTSTLIISIVELCSVATVSGSF